MADTQNRKLFEFTGGVNIKVNGLYKINEIGSTLDRIAKGTKLNNFWKTQESLISSVTRAASKFSKEVNTSNASNLVTNVNALKARYGGDISELFPDFSKIGPQIESAMSMVGKNVGEYTVANFKQLYGAGDIIEKLGYDAEAIFDRVAHSPEQAIQKIKEMSSALDEAIARSAELETKLEDAESGSGARKLRDQISEKDMKIADLTVELNSLKKKATEEFNSFLTANEIGTHDSRVDALLDDVRTGALSAKEGIIELKGTCKDLFNSTEITSGFGEDGLTKVLQNIEKIMTSMEELRTQMNSIKSGDFSGSDSFSPLADGADEQIDKQADSLRRLGSASESVSGIKEILAPLMELMQGAGQEASSLSTFLTELATGFDRLNTVAVTGGESFSNVTSALYSLSKLNNLKISPTPFKNLSEGLRNLSEGVGAGIDPSKLAALSSVNFSGFSNITVKKASLANLAEYLPVIAAVNPARLQKIGEVNLTNFNNIKVKPDAIQSIAQLAEAVSALKDNDIIQIARNYASAGEQMGSSAGAQADEMNKIINAASSAGNIKLDFSGDNIATVQRYLESLNIESTVANKMAQAFSVLEGKITSVSASGTNAIGEAGDVMKVVVKGVRDGADGTIENIERVIRYAKKAKSDGGEWYLVEDKKATVKFADEDATDLKSATDAFSRLAKVRNEIASTKASMYKLDSSTQEYAVLNERLSQQVDLRKQIAQEVAATAKQNPQIIAQAQEESQYYEKISEGISKAAQARAKYDDKVASSATKTAASYKQVNDAIAKGQNILNSASSDQIGTQEYMAVQAGVNKLRAIIGDQTQIDFEVNVEGAQKARIEIDNLMGAISKYKSEVASVGDTDFSTNIEKAKISLQSIEQQMSAFRTDSGLSAEFDKLKADLDGIQNSADLSKWNTQVDLFIQKVRAADLAFRDASMDMVADDKVSSYLKKVTQMYDRVQKAQVNWSKAKKSTAKDEYADLERQRVQLEKIMQILKGAEGGGITNADFASIAQQVNALGAAFENVSRKVQEVGANSKSAGDRMKGLVSKFSWWLSASQLVMTGYNKLREGVTAVIEIDDALVDLQKTTTGTKETYDAFAKSANDAAKSLGVTTQEYIQMTAEWSRLGYNLQDSAKMAETSSIFAAISPEMDTSTATEGLISIMKAFKIEANDAMDGIASKVNVLGNEFAVNNNDLIESMMRSASALSAGRNSLEESLSLATAATEVVRDADMVGEGIAQSCSNATSCKREYRLISEAMLTRPR